MEDGAAVSSQREGHRFLSKERWRAKFSKNEEKLARETNPQPDANDDVADFLKPSTTRARALLPKTPQIDVKAAQRWPGASDLKTSSPGLGIMKGGRTPQRARRKMNLVVSFVKTPPEIIGEGGDESEIPSIEIYKQREFIRAQAERQRRPQDDSGLGLESWTGRRESAQQAGRGEHATGSVGRSHTVHNAQSPPRQERRFDPLEPLEPPQKIAQEQAGFRPSPLKRAATGRFGDDGVARPSFDEEEDAYSPQDSRGSSRARSSTEGSQRRPQGLPAIRAGLRTSLDDSSPDDARAPYLDTQARNPDSRSFKIQHKMRAEEGRALQESVRNSTLLSLEDESRSSLDSQQHERSPGGRQLSVKTSNPYAPAPIRYGPALVVQDPRHAQASDQPSHSRNSSSSSITYASPTSQHSTHAPSLVNSYYEGAHQGPGSLLPSPSPLPATNSLPGYFPPTPTAPRHRPTPSQESHDAPDTFNDAQNPLSPTRPADQSSHRTSPLPPSPGIQIPTDSYKEVRQPETQRPTAPSPHDSYGQPVRQDTYKTPITPKTPGQSPGGESALNDFADRVQHMRGIFRLTAELNRPISAHPPMEWLRASIWWFLKGRAGLEVLLRNRAAREGDQRSSPDREQLAQPHVDLAKTWWILTEVLQNHAGLRQYSSALGSQAASARDAGDDATAEIYDVLDITLANLRALVSSMSRNQVMPPHQSLVQGQDQTIWVEYPSFAPDVVAILSGNASRSLTVSQQNQSQNPLLLMPLTDNKNDFVYGRMFVQVSLATEDAQTDRVMIPCLLSIMRGRNDWEMKITICSQSELVNVSVQGDGKLGSTWNDVKWKTKSRGMYVRLPRGFTLNVEFTEQDYRQLWGIYDYTRKVESSLLPGPDERLMQEVTLLEFQYSETPSSKAFPAERVKRCRVRVFERAKKVREGTGERRLHRGYRLLVVTSPKHKTLSRVDHLIGQKRPIQFEFGSDPKADGAPAMALRIKEDVRQCQLSLTFGSADDRNRFYGAISGMNLNPDETTYAQLRISDLNVEQADQAESFSHSNMNVCKRLQWRDLQVINSKTNSPGAEHKNTVLSSSLRVLSRCTSGAITDRVNCSPGELKLRLSTNGGPELQVLRVPQEDLTVSIDASRSEVDIPDALAELMQAITTSHTIRTYRFSSLQELHTFQSAITGFAIRFDGVATSFAISRRRMVVPIYKQWTASSVRLQVVQQENVVQLLAFFEEFSHADSMAFQMKSMDVFEKADKGGKFGVKLVDAKFNLPNKEKRGKDRGDKDKGSDDDEPGDSAGSSRLSGMERVQRKFVCLDMLEYPGEHDDITICFEDEAGRDRFLSALPAAVQIPRMISFKRKI